MQDFKQERSSHQLQEAAYSSLIKSTLYHTAHRCNSSSGRPQPGIINVVRGPEGLYSNVLTIHVFIYENVLEESLNYNMVLLLIPDWLILLVL